MKTNNGRPTSIKRDFELLSGGQDSKIFNCLNDFV